MFTVSVPVSSSLPLAIGRRRSPNNSVSSPPLPSSPSNGITLNYSSTSTNEPNIGALTTSASTTPLIISSPPQPSGLAQAIASLQVPPEKPPANVFVCQRFLKTIYLVSYVD